MEYFEAIYPDLLGRSATEFTNGTKKNLYQFDSTIINLSGYLIRDGLQISSNEQDSQIKVSIGLKNNCPSSIRFCSEQSESSEDIALVSRAINEAKIEKDDILLFDRDISKAGSFKEFCQKDYKFITRVSVGRKHVIIRKNDITATACSESRIIEDVIVNIYSRSQKKPLTNNLRLIKMINRAGNEIWFLSNLFDMPAYEVTELYRRRWDIEVFLSLSSKIWDISIF